MENAENPISTSLTSIEVKRCIDCSNDWKKNPSFVRYTVRPYSWNEDCTMYNCNHCRREYCGHRGQMGVCEKCPTPCYHASCTVLI